MKQFILRLCVVAALICSVSNAHAQWAELTGGSMSFTIADPLNTLLQANGVSGAVFTPAPFDIRIPFVAINSGILNQTSGTGYVSLGGEIDFNNNINDIKIDQLSFENLGNTALLTGNVYVNNHYIVRLIVFQVNMANPFKAPFPLGAMQCSSIPATFATGITSMLAKEFGITVPNGTVAVMVGINTAMAAVGQT
jgi:hypothetical protein